MTSESPLRRPFRVLLADANDAFLDGLTDWFEERTEIDIVGRAHSHDETLLRVASLKPDLVLVDTSLPDGNGFDVVRSIKNGADPPLVLMMSFHDSESIRFTASSGGADGCITKADIPATLVSHIATLNASARREPDATGAPRKPRRGIE